LNYQETAYVNLKVLEFSSGFVREKNKKIIDLLKRKFKKEGYYCLKPRNYVPVIIKPSDFLSILKLLELNFNSLLENARETPLCLKFPLNFCLLCLHG
jgi:hypothetical protein